MLDPGPARSYGGEARRSQSAAGFPQPSLRNGASGPARVRLGRDITADDAEDVGPGAGRTAHRVNDRYRTVPTRSRSATM